MKTFGKFWILLLAVNTAWTKPVELVWAPGVQVRATKGEQVTYAVTYPIPDRTHHNYRITFTIAEADTLQGGFTTAESTDRRGFVDFFKGFDKVSQVLLGSPVPPLAWNGKERMSVILGDPITVPVQISPSGPVANPHEVFGPPIKPVGKARVKGRVLGWETVEGYPCLKIEGIYRTLMDESSGFFWQDRAEIFFSPALGRIIKAKYNDDSNIFGGVPTVMQWVSPTPLSLRALATPLTALTLPTPAFPPLPKKTLERLTALHTAATRHDPDETARLGTDLLAKATDRDLVNMDPQWYQGLRTYVRDVLHAVARPSPGDVKADAFAQKVRRLALADAGDQPALHAWLPRPAPRTASTWRTGQLLTLVPSPVTPTSFAALYVAPGSSSLWLARNGELQPLSDAHSSLVTRQSSMGSFIIRQSNEMVHVTEEGVVVTQSLSEASDGVPRLQQWALASGAASASPVTALALTDALSPWHLLTDARNGNLLYFINQSSMGSQHQIFLSAWDLQRHHWAFEHRWLADFTLPEGGARCVVSALLNADHSALLCGFSNGFLVCTDALTGEIRWMRLMDFGTLPMLLASEATACGWFPGTHDLVAFDLLTGKDLWRAQRPDGPQWMDLKNHRLYVQGSTSIIALDERLGTEVWRFVPPDPSLRSTGTGLLMEDKLWLPYGGHLFAVAAETGTLLAQGIRADPSACRLLADPQDASRLWVLTADRLEQLRPAP